MKNKLLLITLFSFTINGCYSVIEKSNKKEQKNENMVKVKKIFFNELPDDEKKLFEEALKVRNNSQAPYSNYHVGVAVLSSQGTIHVGCNVERCTWTQTTHAEQNAIDSMIAKLGPSKLSKVAVIGAKKDIEISLTKPMFVPIKTTVCGHCLQIIWENCFQDPNVKILILEENGMVACYTIADLLPVRFGPEHLNIFYENKE